MIISPKAMGYINSRGLDINDPRTNISMESYDTYNSIFSFTLIKLSDNGDIYD